MPTSRLLRGIGAAVSAAASIAALLIATASPDSGRRSALAAPTPYPGGGATVARPARGGHGPNIVFVLTDDLSTDLLQYMPHVQALARAGTSFLDYFVVDSLCCPSRASILTGNYPHDTGVYLNAGPHGGYRQFVQMGNTRKTFGVALQSVGYRTGFMGKYLNHYPSQSKGTPPPGWDQWDVIGTEGYQEFGYHLNENGQVHYYGHRPGDYLTDVLSRKAVSFIDHSANSRRPFALEVATYAPHRPSVPAPADRGSFPGLRAPRGLEWDRLPANAPTWLAGYPHLSAADAAGIDRLYRKRVESVQAVDRMVGRLESELARRGLLKHTYFVFSSDNGFHMGQRRMLPGKQTAYDTDVRVPLIVSGPGVPADHLTDALVSSIDLAPTFERIAGARVHFRQDGTSMLPLWHGKKAPTTWPPALLIEHRASQFPGDPDAQAGRSGMAPSYDALRTKDFLYVEYANGDREYYDLRTDPDELSNVIGELSLRRTFLLHRWLESMRTCHGVNCRTRSLAVD